MVKVLESRIVEKPKKTIYDCCREDSVSLDQIQRYGLDYLIGHKRFGETASGFFYRGHTFSITLEGKLAHTDNP